MFFRNLNHNYKIDTDLHSACRLLCHTNAHAPAVSLDYRLGFHGCPADGEVFLMEGLIIPGNNRFHAHSGGAVSIWRTVQPQGFVVKWADRQGWNNFQSRWSRKIEDRAALKTHRLGSHYLDFCLTEWPLPQQTWQTGQIDDYPNLAANTDHWNVVRFLKQEIMKPRWKELQKPFNQNVSYYHQRCHWLALLDRSKRQPNIR